MTVVAFLRAMNLGGRRITNSDLTAAFEAIGFADASPFQASGNVLLRKSAATSATAQRIASGLAAELGYPVPTFLRSAEQLNDIVQVSPYADRAGAAGGTPQIILLDQGEVDSAALVPIRPPGDTWELIGTELHWLPADGLSVNGLSYSALERVVGVHTIRTLGTISRLAHKAAAD